MYSITPPMITASREIPNASVSSHYSRSVGSTGGSSAGAQHNVPPINIGSTGGRFEFRPGQAQQHFLQNTAGPSREFSFAPLPSSTTFIADPAATRGRSNSSSSKSPSPPRAPAKRGRTNKSRSGQGSSRSRPSASSRSRNRHPSQPQPQMTMPMGNRGAMVPPPSLTLEDWAYYHIVLGFFPSFQEMMVQSPFPGVFFTFAISYLPFTFARLYRVGHEGHGKL